MIRSLCALCVLCALVLFSTPSRAQSAPQMRVSVDVDTLGVGDVLHLTLSATSADQMPTDAQPGPTPAFAVRSTSASPSQTHININGNRIDRYTLTVDWTLQASRVGTFTLGPPTVVVGTTRFTARGTGVTVRVVPAGQAPSRAPPQPPNPFGISPFDPWKSLFPGATPFDQQPDEPPSVTTDPKLALEAPRGSLYFLHATVESPGAVVGEQVTFTVYEYVDTSASGFEVDAEDVHDPRAADFVKRPLLRDDQEAQLAGYATIAGRTWSVKIVRRWALFPLHAGDLEIGPMSVNMLRPRALAGQKRTTETIRVHVTEPPLEGRPAGYALGDVGRFAIAAEVSPRETQPGGAVAVHVELSGTGNLPAAIAAPAREGVEWLAPEVHEQIGAIGRDTFGGKRTFDFVVRPRRAGDVDLGEIALPFWNPGANKYDVARAALGIVRVSGASSAAAPRATSDEMLPGLPPPRDALDGSAVARAHADDSPLFWVGAIGGWPLAFGVAVGARAAGRRAASAWKRRRTSPAADLKERISAARDACDAADARAADAAIARALETATVVHANVSVRGAVGDELVDRLVASAVPRDTASRFADLLRECDVGRFAPDAADITAARDRWKRARHVIRDLQRSVR